MQELVDLLADRNIITFFLLFIKLSLVLAFFPFFSFATFSNSIKAPLALVLTIVFYPLAPLYSLDINMGTLVMAVASEILLAILATFLLKLVFDVMIFTSELISLTMGLSMAMVYDPLSENQSTIIGQTLGLLSLVTFLSFDGDHLILLFVSSSLEHHVTGTFTFSSQIVEYMLLQMKNFFVLGFSIAFPILAVGLLGDIIFGMIMKTMPQFNLLVLGFPIKIGLSIVVLLAVIASMLLLIKKNFLILYNSLPMLF
jgi:flagellar biosynthetic protein FliR